MTVIELIKELQKLNREGRGNFPVAFNIEIDYDDGSDIVEIKEVYMIDEVSCSKGTVSSFNGTYCGPHVLLG